MAPFRRVLQGALDALAALVFPAPCRICEATLLTASHIPVCAECLASLAPFTGPQCRQCGRPYGAHMQPEVGSRKSEVGPQTSVRATLDALQAPLCHLCRRGVYAFDVARSYAPYNDAMVRAIVLLKYHAVTPLGDWFGARLAELAAREPDTFAADAVVPVPLHPLRQRERGFNQAELIARPLARGLGLPLSPLLLVRTKPRPDKLKLTRRERWMTVRGAYGVQQGSQVDKLRVLLVDDVFTTGATLDACARVLRQAGAARIAGITVARVAPNWVSLVDGSPARSRAQGE
jgi:ComF family protein